MTWPPSAPGTAPRIRSRFLSRSTCTTLQILGGAALHAHVAGHAPALEYAARRLTLADGARRAVRQGHAVGRGHTTEVVTLHGAGEALADGGAGDVHLFAFLEEVGLDLGAGLEFIGVGIGKAKLHQRLAGSDVGAGVMARQRLRIQLRAARAVGDLHGAIAVFVLRLHLRDAVRQNLDHGHRHSLAGVGENARHAGLAADQSDSHFCPHKFARRHCDWRLQDPRHGLSH